MKKSLLFLVSALAVSLILLSIAVPVNNSSTLPSLNNGAIQADGVPTPPQWIPHVINPNLVADGIPLPPPWIPHVLTLPATIGSWKVRMRSDVGMARITV